MRAFAYDRAADLPAASNLGRDTGSGQTDAPTQFLAGGTTLIDLMRLDVLRPERLVDINPLRARLQTISVRPEGLFLGAMATMAQAADDPDIRRDYPLVAQSLALAASPQLRNMATLGGNVLQRTRCVYYRDPSWAACNKRNPGSGCAALGRPTRQHAVLGVDRSCISQYPGDFAVVLAALEAQVELTGPQGPRRLDFTDLHRRPQEQPQLETTLRPAEVITGFLVPAGSWTRRSVYLKVRDRESYEFALAAAAVALDMDGRMVRQARIGLGGCAYRPWRSAEAEAALTGKPLTEASAQASAQVALAGAVTHGENDFKPELVRRTLVRALLEAGELQV